MKELTRAEEQVMQVLWDLKNAHVKDVINKLPSPKPAYNTVSTIIRILEKKGFAGHQAIGRSHRYFPKITRENYKKQSLKKLLSGYFGGSITELISFFVQKENVDMREMDEIMNLLNKQKKERKK